MPNIFISYRREDSLPYAGRLREALVRRFGKRRVFMDLDSINPGENFANRITSAESGCDIVVAIIGKQWAQITDKEGRRRLECENDFVRLELTTALSGSTLLIPVLVQGAPMPTRSELPLELAALSEREACELSDSRWDYDVGRLLEVISPHFPSLLRTAVQDGIGVLGRNRRRVLWSLLFLGAAGGMVWELFQLVRPHFPEQSPIDQRSVRSAPEQAATNMPDHQTSSTTPSEAPVTFEGGGKPIFHSPAPTEPRQDLIREVRLLQETKNAIWVEVDYAYTGDYGANGIVILLQALDDRGDYPVGSDASVSVGIGNGTLRLRMRREPSWPPVRTTNLEAGFYRISREGGADYELLGGTARFPYEKFWNQ